MCNLRGRKILVLAKKMQVLRQKTTYLVCDCCFEVAKSFQYLGTTINEDLNEKDEVSEIL